MCRHLWRETWNEIEEFGKAKSQWLKSFLPLPNGIPSADTFNRVFQALDPKHFQACFVHWKKAVAEVPPAQVIALDGKTALGSQDAYSAKTAIHMVSAWASSNRLVLAQVRVEAKSNEITAIPQLLPSLAIKGCIVTIDAIGTQREIAQQILDQDGDYVLALKQNQGTLHQDVVDTFAHGQAGTIEELAVEDAPTIDKGYGRLEVRRYRFIPDVDVLGWLQEGHRWPGLSAIGMVEAERRLGGEECTSKTRYYLLSRPLQAKAFGQAVRSHWDIENQVRWILDVGFHEDQSRIRASYAAENRVVLRHLALNLLQHQAIKGLSVKARRLKAAWDNDYLFRVLHGISMRRPWGVVERA